MLRGLAHADRLLLVPELLRKPAAEHPDTHPDQHADSDANQHANGFIHADANAYVDPSAILDQHDHACGVYALIHGHTHPHRYSYCDNGLRQSDGHLRRPR
jgi:hypothetical protein